MVRPEVVRKRLQKLDEYLAFLETLAPYPYERFESDFMLRGSAERYLHLAIEAINDLGNHAIADGGLGKVEQYRDIPEILFRKNIINGAQMEVWVRMIGFRNTLVHDYTDIDKRIVYRVLQENLGDLKEIRAVFAGYL
jgi:uncharacterized protein YutE (UPF0331/DUF86 family)